jgi:hypothetical protein
LKRVYEIRRDLEHEDDEYEAGIEDCIYIFRTCVRILASDPVQIIRVTDVKDIVEKPNAILPTEEILEAYQSAYIIRQKEILLYLISNALDTGNPDIVRQNCFDFLKLLEPYTQNDVKIEIAHHIQERIGRYGRLDAVHAKVSYACGSFPYLKFARVRDYFVQFNKKLEKVGYRWDKYKEHRPLLEELEDIGGLEFCPPDVQESIVKWMILAYMGERGGYGMFGTNRPVFYSNIAAPIIERILKEVDGSIVEQINKLQDDKDIKKAMSNKLVARRYEELLDLVENMEEEE